MDERDGAAELEQAIDRYNEAWNAHDVPAIVAMHAPGMVFENHTAGERVEGDDVAPHIARIFENWPDLTFRGRRSYVRDGLVVSEWTATATDGDGRRLEWDGVDLFPFEDGLILRKDVYSSAHRARIVEGQGAPGARHEDFAGRSKRELAIGRETRDPHSDEP